MAEHKLILLGNQGVGKTALTTRFVYNVFEDSYTSTIGMDFFTKTMMLENGPMKFQMWDTAGQERFVCLLPSYIRDSSVALVLYDITNKTSFLDVSKWIVNVRSERGSNVIIILVGSKVDEEAKREVSLDDAQIKAQMMGIRHIETSAKTGVNVKELFQMIIEEITEHQPDIRLQATNKTRKEKILLGETPSCTWTGKCSC